MMARNVPSSIRPLPQDNFRSGNNSGRRPYLEGPKNELWTPIKNTQPSSTGIWFHQKPASARSITPISKIFTLTLMVRLLKRSARKPPAIENRMNGSENRAVTSSPTRCNSAGGDVHAEDHEHDEPLQDVVAERALELRDEERPEAAQTTGGVRGLASGVWRPGSGIRGLVFGHGIQANPSGGKL